MRIQGAPGVSYCQLIRDRVCLFRKLRHQACMSEEHVEVAIRRFWTLTLPLEQADDLLIGAFDSCRYLSRAEDNREPSKCTRPRLSIVCSHSAGHGLREARAGLGSRPTRRVARRTSFSQPDICAPQIQRRLQQYRLLSRRAIWVSDRYCPSWLQYTSEQDIRTMMTTSSNTKKRPRAFKANVEEFHQTAQLSSRSHRLNTENTPTKSVAIVNMKTSNLPRQMISEQNAFWPNDTSRSASKYQQRMPSLKRSNARTSCVIHVSL